MTPAQAPALIGILALDSRFPRIAGDVGNPATYPFPVRVARVSGALPDHVVLRRGEGLFDAFVAAGQGLVDAGARAIVTTCGFLSLVQDRLAVALPVPVATSALLLLPVIQRTLPRGARVGVITASERTLTPAHFAAVGADPATATIGVAEGGGFYSTFVMNGERLDIAAARAEVVAAARELCRREPDIGAILLECANMGPYALAVRAETGLPVFDMVGLVHWLHRAFAPEAFAAS